MQRSKRTCLTAAAAGFLIVLCLISFLFLPAYRHEEQLNAELAQLRHMEAALEQMPLPENYRPEAAASWMMRVPVQENAGALMETFLALEAKSGAKIEFMEWKEPQAAEDEGFTVQRIMLTISGTYEQAAGYWAGMDQLDRLIRVKAWTLTRITEAGSVRLQFLLEGYTAPGFSSLET